MPSGTATVPLLHRLLAIGLLVLGAAFVGVRSFGLAPALGPDVAPTVAYALSAVAFVLAWVAFFVIKPRVPERPPGKSVAEYWSTPDLGARALPFWFLLEGAGTIALAGFFLTGEWVAAITAGAAIVLFWLAGPNLFARS